MRLSRHVPFALLLLVACAYPSAAMPARPLALDDLYAIAHVSDVRLSPDGRWVAYTVTRSDREEDRDTSDVWMVSWDGREQRQLTFSRRQ